MRILEANIPKEYARARLRDFPDIKIENWDWTGFCLRGKPGIGKTHFATALAAEFLKPTNPKTLFNKYNKTYLDKTIGWFTVPDLLFWIRSSFDQKSEETEMEIVNKLRSYPVLVLDDLGAEKVTDFTKTALYNIISSRINSQLKTIITTNQTLSQIQKWEPRLASRLAGFMTVKLPDKDRRIKKGN